MADLTHRRATAIICEWLLLLEWWPWGEKRGQWDEKHALDGVAVFNMCMWKRLGWKSILACIACIAMAGNIMCITFNMDLNCRVVFGSCTNIIVTVVYHSPTLPPPWIPRIHHNTPRRRAVMSHPANWTLRAVSRAVTSHRWSCHLPYHY